MIEGLSREVSEDWSSRRDGERIVARSGRSGRVCKPMVLAQWLKMI